MNFKVTAALTLLALPGRAGEARPTLPARTFPLGEVRLLESPFKAAMERNAEYLLRIEPDRLLHNTLELAGLPPKGERYGGWESRGIAGHTLGHYLTALAQQYAATGDPRFRERLDYLVAELARAQAQYGDGYTGALPAKELATLRGFESGRVQLSGKFNFAGGAWVPWYTQHKVLAGLIDAWTLGGNAQAREVALGLAAFTDKVTKNLPPAELQKMLGVEHGGMLEALVQLYELTQDAHWLEVSRRFYHQAVLDPLARGQDPLTGIHANTQIPKVIGEARTYEATGKEEGRRIAENFWNLVVKKRSWVIGGNSNLESFFPPGAAHLNMGTGTAETCNTYNMLKLTEHLYAWEPSVEKGDFYERALFNHILGSQEPRQSMFTYFVSLKPGSQKVYSTPFDSFWCCVGTGMENHTKYGEAIYFHGAEELYVNLFIPSVLTWKEKGLVVEQHTRFPEEAATEFVFQEVPGEVVPLKIRCPSWLAAAPAFTLNGQPLAVEAQAGRMATLARAWKKGDVLRMTLPMALHRETLEDDPRRVAFLYGPLVLAGDLGPASEAYLKDQRERARDPGVKVPLLVGEPGPALLAALRPVPGEPLTFRTEGLARPEEVTLRPFHSLAYRYYTVYWEVVAPQEWEAQRAARETAEARERAQAERVVDQMNFGEQQPEADHGLTAERSETGLFHDRKWRDAGEGGFIRYRLKVQPGVKQVLSCTYWGSDVGREFRVLINGEVIATQKLERARPERFFEVEYPLPAAATQDQQSIEVRFEPVPGHRAGGFFGTAVLKALEKESMEKPAPLP